MLWTLLAGGGWFEDESGMARMKVQIREGDAWVDLKTNAVSGKLTRGGTTIQGIRALMQVQGTSPDYDTYRILSGTTVVFRLFTVEGTTPPVYNYFYTKELTRGDVRDTNDLPFDGQWKNLVTLAGSGVGYATSADGWWTWDADFIESMARSCANPCLTTGDSFWIRFGFDVDWGIPDSLGDVETPNLVESVSVSVKLEAGAATLDGQITTENVV